MDASINQQFKYQLSISSRQSCGENQTLAKDIEYDGGELTLEPNFPDHYAVFHIAIVYPECLIPSTSGAVGVPTNSLVLKNFTRETRGLFCDVKFIVEGDLVEAHRIILASQSHVFLEMLTAVPKVKEPIEIKDISFKAFCQYLDAVYCLDSPTDPMICFEVIKLAEKYGTTNVKDLVRKNLLDLLSIRNAIKILIAADLNHAFDLKSAAINFLSNYQMEDLPDFEELAANEILLKEVMKTNRKKGSSCTTS